MSTAGKDPYTSKAAQDASPSEKLAEIRAISKAAKFAMLTTQSADKTLHSRAMSPASDKGLVYSFIGNQDSGKFDELAANSDVNISFSDASSTDWVSVAGKASVLTDTEKIKEHWNPLVKSWFGDLGDGKHTGDYTDPRVALIEIVPSEIRYWHKTSTSVGQAYEVLKGAVTGETAAPGSLKVLTGPELHLLREVEQKKV